MIVAGAIGIIVMLVIIWRVANGNLDRRAGEYALGATALIMMISLLVILFVSEKTLLERIGGMTSGFDFAFDYFFPEPTLDGKIRGILLGIFIDIAVGVALLYFIGNSRYVDAAIVAIPMAYHFARTLNPLSVENLMDAQRVGAAFWATIFVSWIMIIPSCVVIKWVARWRGV